MNLADPQWELLDPTPNVHNLFVHFDELFFNTKLASRAIVRWSKRMYSCAGVCSYEGRNGLCDIALSEPLLKLRPRKDLIETLLHEMIHAFLFITNRDKDRDGHGPNFQFHMHRINKAAGLKISIYHDFHDEVKLYLTHVWRCNGKCQNMKPYFGIVRRSSNRSPGPQDRWWDSHRRFCGGTFIKIQEPERKEKKQKAPKKNEKSKTNADITKYINNNSNNIVNKNVNKGINANVAKGVNKENKTIPPLPSADFDNIMKTNVIIRKSNDSVIEKVRDVWKNKILPTSPVQPKPTIKPVHKTTPIKSQIGSSMTKHKTDSKHEGTPAKKMKKIDDYFMTSAHSILKDVYGKDFIITQPNDGKKLKAVAIEQGNNCNITELVRKMDNLVDCPSCKAKVSVTDINKHLDECLNKDLIDTLSKESNALLIQNDDKIKLQNIVGSVSEMPPFKFKTDIHNQINQSNETKGKLKGPQSVPDLNIKLENPVNYKSNNKAVLTKGELSNEHKQLLMKNDQMNEEIKSLLYFANSKKDVTAVPGTSKEVKQLCPCCGKRFEKSFESHIDECLGFFDNNTTIPNEGVSSSETVVIADFNPIQNLVKIEADGGIENQKQKCPCCGIKVEQTIELHLDECLGFFNNDNTLPQEGASAVETIVIDDDDDDEFDETQILNATGTKSPCPCCLKMVEIAEMSEHLDICLES